MSNDLMSSNFDQSRQNIHGDQYNVIGNLNLTRLNPADLRNQRNHAVLRQAVRRFWIDGVLKGSLYNEVHIRLGLDARPEDQLHPDAPPNPFNRSWRRNPA